MTWIFLIKPWPASLRGNTLSFQHTHLKFNSELTPEKKYRSPRGKARLPTIIFQGASCCTSGVYSLEIYMLAKHQMSRSMHVRFLGCNPAKKPAGRSCNCLHWRAGTRRGSGDEMSPT